METLPRTVGDHYQIAQLIGQGGMGDVYQGVDRRSQTPVAIKILRRERVSAATDTLARFRREGEALRALAHPNIVRMLDAIQHEDEAVIVMEFLTGGSLATRLKRDGPLPIEATVDVALQIADALTRSHYLDIVHRDIKPENVLLAKDGRACLTDFGLARFRRSNLTQDGALVGTLNYLSPESVQGQEADRATDIWSFGVTLFELLTGRPPFVRPTPSATLLAILSEAPPDLEQLRPETPPALVDLIYRMLLKDPAGRLPSVRLAGVELEALRRHRAGDGAPPRPATAAGLKGRFAAPTHEAHGSRRVNLPGDATPFVGRDREVGELTALLRRPGTRLVTVLGPSGMGKTRLAVETVRAIAQAYPDGVAFVPLASLTAAESLLTAIWEAVGYPPIPTNVRSPEQQTGDFFRHKDMVLILDNFEDILEAANLVDDLLQAAPKLRVLVTSTERLNLRCEMVYRLGAMSYPSASSDPEARAHDAVRLFADAATRARPGFEVGPTNLPHIIGIARLVQGLPLGLLLAASWVDALPVADIYREIATGLDFLETEMRDVPDRQRSIRAVFGHAWRRLSAEEQAVFAHLAVFRGGFDREAAQAITGTTVRSLMALVNKSLVWREPASGRYHTHRLLRRYAEDALARRDALEETRQKHAAYYTDLAEAIERKLFGPDDAGWFRAIRQENDNFAAALNWSLGEGNAPLLGGRLFAALGIDWFYFDSVVDGPLWMRRSLRVATELPPLVQGRVMARAALMCCLQGDYARAADHGGRAVDVLRPEKNPRELAYALSLKANFNQMIGRMEIARPAAEECLQVAYQAEDPTILAVCLTVAAGFAQMRGDQQQADRYWQEVLQISDSFPGRYVAGLACRRRAFMARNAGEFEAALKHYRQALALQQELGRRSSEVFTLAEIAYVHFLQGDLDEAGRLFDDGAAQSREIAQNSRLSVHLIGLALASYGQGDRDRAADSLAELLRLKEDAGWRQVLAAGLMGKLAWDAGRHEPARLLLTAAESLGRARGERPFVWFDDAWQAILDEVSADGAVQPENRGLTLSLEQAVQLAQQTVSELVAEAR